MAQHPTPPPNDWYAELEVSPDATSAEIDSSYRRLARTLHPDTATARSTDVDRLQRVFEAHALLSDPERRREYDERRDAKRVPAGSHEPRPCPVCGGARVVATPCGACHASGFQDPHGLWIATRPCAVCLGSGSRLVRCGACGGTGRTTSRDLR